jgi:hypothetical protein
MEIKDRIQLADVLNDMGLLRAAAEIGTHKGAFASAFLDKWRGEKLYVIDPWRKLGEEYAGDWVNDGDRGADYNEAIQALSRHAGRFSVLRMLSKEASQEIPDGALDFVYIDANHNEAFIREDLALWYPKVHTGGIFAGHDYLCEVTWPGVQKAVNEFSAAHHIEKINLTWETGESWWWIKPWHSAPTS